nr:unnamed protein product [Naegleria fowleri]
MREVGIVFECFNCGTYFVNTVKKYYEQFNNRYQLCVCPTCNELIYNVKYQDMLVSVDHPCILSLCRAFKFLQEEEEPSSTNTTLLQGNVSSVGSSSGSSSSSSSSDSDTLHPNNIQPSDLIELFEQKPIHDVTKEKAKKQHAKKKDQTEDESLLNYDPGKGVPLFMDVSTGQSTKQKWELVFGVGPQRLELDSSRSGRLYMASLKALNLPYISTHLYKMKENQTSKQLEEICNKISKLCLMQESQLSNVMN